MKIKKAGGAPAVMVTLVNEDEQPEQQRNSFRGGRGGMRHGFGRGGNFKNMVNGFLEKMGVDLDVEKIAETCGKNPWAFANGDRCGGHKQKRAILV